MDSAAYETLRAEVIDAIWKDLDPLEQRIEDSESLPYEAIMPVLERIRAFGFLIPEEYGGCGMTVSQYLPVIAEFAKIQGGIRVVVHVHNSMAHALAAMGNEQQRAAVLPGAAEGRLSVAFALTEPDHGTGADTGTTATADGGDYVIDGRKWLITNSDIASHFIVFARTSAAAVSAILVERDCPGLSIRRLPETMGCKGGEHGLLTFAGVRVPCANLLGEEGRGVEQMEEALEISRVFIAASSLGTAERALELSLAHAKGRVTFGRPIAERQAVQRYLAEMATDVYALRHMLRDAAARWDGGSGSPPRRRCASSSAWRRWAASPTARFSSTAASATRASTPSSGCTVTRASTGWRRAPPPFSTWSPRGSSSVATGSTTSSPCGGLRVPRRWVWGLGGRRDRDGQAAEQVRGRGRRSLVATGSPLNERRVALVTGGSAGIGRGTVLELARRGCDVLLTYRSRAVEAAAMVRDLQDAGTDCLAVPYSLDSDAPGDLIDAALGRWGRLDSLVVNAGTWRGGRLADMDDFTWWSVVERNLRPASRLVRAALPAIRGSPGGSVLLVSSVVGLIGFPGDTAYATVKAAMTGFARALAKEVAADGVRVNVLAPGFVETDMTQQIPARARSRISDRILLGRFGTPEEIGRAAAFISEDATYMTGSVVVVDGGWSL